LENVSEKDVFQKPWNEVALPKWEFEKWRADLQKWVLLELSGDKKVFKNFGALGT
jgi:hypothetical protein